MNFYYIYKALAHPDLYTYTTPFTLEERLLHIAEAKRTLGTRVPWIADTMENKLKHALGDASNSEFVIDSDGRVLIKRMWSNPEMLRSDLEHLVGQVETPTQIEELGLQTAPPPKQVTTGIVPRLSRSPMIPIRVEPASSNNIPFYVKLRAEANHNLLQKGKGELYLGFYLDPLLKVHWNNLVAPPQFELSTPEGVTATPDRGIGPKVEKESDVDPREFLIEINGRANAPINATVRYFACDDAETFCIPATQTYRIYLQRDIDGGRRFENYGKNSETTSVKPGQKIKQLRRLDTTGNRKIGSD